MKRRFGVRLDGWMVPERCVELAVAAEACGFDALWYAENPFGRGVLPTVAACGRATKRIEHGIGVFSPFIRHPALMAMEMGALDELLGGRSNLGLGTGIPSLFSKTRIPFEKPIAALRDTVTIIRALMRGETVTYDGKVFSASGLKLEFDPLRKDYPIFIASMGEQSIRLTGEVADGLIVSNLCTPAFSTRAIEAANAVADKRRLPAPLRVVQYAPCVAGADRASARDFARDFVGKQIASAFGPKSTPVSRRWHLEGSGIAEADFIEMATRMMAGASARTIVSDTVLDLYAVAGNADDCIAAYHRYFDAGVSEVVVTFRGPEPFQEMNYLRDALRTFA